MKKLVLGVFIAMGLVSGLYASGVSAINSNGNIRSGKKLISQSTPLLRTARATFTANSSSINN